MTIKSDENSGMQISYSSFCKNFSFPAKVLKMFPFRSVYLTAVGINYQIIIVLCWTPSQTTLLRYSQGSHPIVFANKMLFGDFHSSLCLGIWSGTKNATYT